MKTPIVDFINRYNEKNYLRLHMPGHKGASFLGPEKYDITEINGADVLYQASGIIRESEENASSIFNTAKTLYSTEGSSLSIRAMLYLLSLYGYEKGKKPSVLAVRNVHKTFITAAAVLNLEVEFLPFSKKQTLFSYQIDASELENLFLKTEDLPLALYVTSPDYLGQIADIQEIADICHKFGILLVVDNAHGAYLHFLPDSKHPISLGADLCCDSAHKTLPALTGGAYLHISKNAPSFFSENAERAMDFFASTSPSYLILQSLDLVNQYLAEHYREKLNSFCQKVSSFKNQLLNQGFSLIGNEPLKLSIAPKTFGYTGIELSEILFKEGIVSEFYDQDFTVLMLSPEQEDILFKKLGTVFSKIEKRKKILETIPFIDEPIRVLSIHDAYFSGSANINVSLAEGRTFASAAFSCPPAIPILIAGELVTKSSIDVFRYYGIETCRVIT